jgi:hypothetical protein
VRPDLPRLPPGADLLPSEDISEWCGPLLALEREIAGIASTALTRFYADPWGDPGSSLAEAAAFFENYCGQLLQLGESLLESLDSHYEMLDTFNRKLTVIDLGLRRRETLAQDTALKSVLSPIAADDDQARQPVPPYAVGEYDSLYVSYPLGVPMRRGVMPVFAIDEEPAKMVIRLAEGEKRMRFYDTMGEFVNEDGFLQGADPFIGDQPVFDDVEEVPVKPKKDRLRHLSIRGRTPEVPTGGPTTTTRLIRQRSGTQIQSRPAVDALALDASLTPPNPVESDAAETGPTSDTPG